MGVSSGELNLESEHSSDEGEPVKKKPKASGRSPKVTIKRPSKKRGKNEEDSDEDEPRGKKTKLSGRSTKDITKKSSKTKGKK
jgi:hypothetical protein